MTELGVDETHQPQPTTWWGTWTRTEREPEPPPPPSRAFASATPVQHWLKQRLLACCCVANPSSHVPTRRSPGGLLRKYDDLELHRRRSTTVLLDAPRTSFLWMIIYCAVFL